MFKKTRLVGSMENIAYHQQQPDIQQHCEHLVQPNQSTDNGSVFSNNDSLLFVHSSLPVLSMNGKDHEQVIKLV